VTKITITQIGVLSTLFEPPEKLTTMIVAKNPPPTPQMPAAVPSPPEEEPLLEDLSESDSEPELLSAAQNFDIAE